MAGIRAHTLRLGWLALFAALLVTAAAAQHRNGIDFRVTPQMAGGLLTSLEVEMRMEGNAAGVETLDLPTADAGQTPAIADLAVVGARVTQEAANRRVLNFAPGAEIIVSYKIPPVEHADPASTPGAVIRPDGFAVHGERAFLLAEGRDLTPASVTFAPGPPGWLMISSAPKATTLAELRDTLLLGGRNY